jgi:glutathione synthase/RimK-type ligase-like ATP-grasp enzyme
MPSIIVTNNPDDAACFMPGFRVVSAKEFIAGSGYVDRPGLTVINLCSSYRYRSDGYYVSLLSTARGHTVFPRAKTIQEMKSLPLIRRIALEIDGIIQKSLQSVNAENFTLNVYFGCSFDRSFNRLGRALFGLFPSPNMRAEFVRKKERWVLHNISLLSLDEIPAEHAVCAARSAKKYAAAHRHVPLRRGISSYALAILYDVKEAVPPSDAKAIECFESAAREEGFNTSIIGKDDYDRLSEFDALFIRETTNVNHHTYRFAQRADAAGLVVIDDPVSILRCTNKVYLAERLSRYGIPAPKTVIFSKSNRDSAIRSLGYPLILKEPDGSFSQGVMKASNREEFYRKSDLFFEKSHLILAQEFMPTEYDWRIGIINNEVIYACRYYMAKEHWQIVNWKGKGGVRVGKWDCVPLDEVPPIVLRTALKGAKVIGSGLYGVDLKLVGKNCYIIEVNDNPSIETGVEDMLLGDALYQKIMHTFYERVCAKKEG